MHFNICKNCTLYAGWVMKRKYKLFNIYLFRPSNYNDTVNLQKSFKLNKLRSASAVCFTDILLYLFTSFKIQIIFSQLYNYSFEAAF